MKREINFYKHWFAPVRIKNFLPVFSYSKNVQGWFFTRNYTVEWFTYAINFRVMVNSDYDVEREVAHELNVAKYMNKFTKIKTL
jgi:hypothetical protein